MQVFSRLFVVFFLSVFPFRLSAKGIDQTINDTLRPIADALGDFIFFEVRLFGYDFPLIVMWLAFAAVFFTLYFRFLNIRGFGHAIRLVRGDYDSGKEAGELSHFQALATALSGTVGIGNIGGMAIIISLGGPGTVFWLMVAGFLGMSTKFIECVAGVMFRRENADGSISGGPMYYLEKGLALRGWRKVAKPLGMFYATSIVIGCLGIGNMFQSNQAYEQFVVATGGDTSFFADKGWLFGLVIAIIVALVIIGGIKSIARVTSKIVPFMAVSYILLALTVIFLNADRLPGAISAIVTQAFQPQAAGVGMIGAMVLGFRRAIFSNEAGIGSAAIAHSAVKTEEPVTEGFVGLLEPFIDTVVVCTITSLVILTTVYEPSFSTGGLQGIELTSNAFESTLSWAVAPLAIIAVLFAYSTMITWSYYGLKGWTYLFGESKQKAIAFNLIYCAFVALGCTIQLDAVLDFSDAMVYIIAIPNVIGLYVLAPVIRDALKEYQAKLKDGRIVAKK